jgi:hypothetical protein
MVVMSVFVAVVAIFLRHSCRALYSLGWGGYPHRFGARDAPASRRMFVSLVCMCVHMERTPRLSSASGVTLIFLGNVVQHFVCVRLCFYVGVAFNVVWWAMTILTPLIVVIGILRKVDG